HGQRRNLANATLEVGPKSLAPSGPARIELRFARPHPGAVEPPRFAIEHPRNSHAVHVQTCDQHGTEIHAGVDAATSFERQPTASHMNLAIDPVRKAALQ